MKVVDTKKGGNKLQSLLLAFPLLALTSSWDHAEMGGVEGISRENPSIASAPKQENPSEVMPKDRKEMITDLEAVSVRNVHGTIGSSTPTVLNSKGFSFSVEGFYWKSQEDDLEYAVKGDATADQHFKDEGLHFKWNPGFRLGGSYRFAGRENWDLGANWTWFYNKAHGSVDGGTIPAAINATASEGSQIYPSWGNGIIGNYATSAAAHWRLHYNTVDVDLGRNYFVSGHLSVRPHLGLRGAWIHQNYKATYTANIAGVTSPSTLATQFEAKNNFSGAGLRAGADMQWHFNSHWNLLGRLSASLIYGHFNVKETINTFATSTAATLVRHWNEGYNRVRPNIEGFLGLQYERFCHQGRYHWAATLGYDMAEWFSQNELMDWQSVTNGSIKQSQTNRRHGDLGMQGVTLRFEFDF